MRTHEGFAASPGFGDGAAFVVRTEMPDLPDVDDPAAAFDSAQATVAERIRTSADTAEERGLEDAAEILRAQALMAEDPMLRDEVTARIATGTRLDTAIDEAAATVTNALLESGSEYLAARAADVGEIVRFLRFALAGREPKSTADVPEGSVIVAAELTAADTSTLDPARVRAFVTEHGGPTGHVAVIAKALGIPAVVGVAGATSIDDGVDVLVDGSSGAVHVDPDDEARTAFRAEAAAFEQRAKVALEYHGRAVTVAGRPMLIAANVGSPDDVDAAVAAAADGIGLYRTEVLFLETQTPPSEEEQFAAYAGAAAAFEHPVVIRMFDIGGDKPAPYLDLPHEDNPFLGVRGLRLYEAHRDLAMSQARALLRAAVKGNVWVMVPMVATADDVGVIHRLFDDARAELSADGIDFGDPPIGIMIETPAAAVNARSLAEMVDFFSIGTNDLTQYTMAADRTQASLGGYADAAEPAVVNLCRMTAEGAAHAGISVAVCGEAAADPVLAVLFAAMGINELSVAAPMVNGIRHILSTVEASELPAVLDAACGAGSAAEVRAVVSAVV